MPSIPIGHQILFLLSVQTSPLASGVLMVGFGLDPASPFSVPGDFFTDGGTGGAPSHRFMYSDGSQNRDTIG